MIDDGVEAITFDFGANNTFSGLEDDTALGKTYAQSLTFANALDTSTGTGVSVSFVTH